MFQAQRLTTLLKRESITGVFLRNLWHFQNYLFYRTPPMAASDPLKVTSSKRFMQGTLISSFRTAPYTKTSTSKTTTEIFSLYYLVFCKLYIYNYFFRFSDYIFFFSFVFMFIYVYLINPPKFVMNFSQRVFVLNCLLSRFSQLIDCQAQ